MAASQELPKLEEVMAASQELPKLEEVTAASQEPPKLEEVTPLSGAVRTYLQQWPVLQLRDDYFIDSENVPTGCRSSGNGIHPSSIGEH